MKSKAPLMTSLVKAMSVLDTLIAGDEGVGLSVIAKELNLPLNTVHTILRTLGECGYARLLRRGVYGVGEKIDALRSGVNVVGRDFLLHLEALLTRLVDEQGESYIFAVLQQGVRVTLGAVRSNRAVGVDQAVLAGRSFYAKASSRLLCAYSSPRALEEVVTRNGLPGMEWGGISSLAGFTPECDKIRRQGYCRMITTDLDVIAIAFPMFSETNHLIGVIGSFAPLYRMDDAREAEWTEHLRAAAALGV